MKFSLYGISRPVEKLTRYELRSRTCCIQKTEQQPAAFCEPSLHLEAVGAQDASMMQNLARCIRFSAWARGEDSFRVYTSLFRLEGNGDEVNAIPLLYSLQVYNAYLCRMFSINSRVRH